MPGMRRRSLAVSLLLAACADYERPPRACETLGLLCVQEDVKYDLGLAGSNSVSGDLDGDGTRELVSASAGGLAIGWGIAEQREYQLFAGGVPDVGLGDVDGDGDLDIVFLTAEPPALRVLENRGTRALAEGPTLALTGTLNDLWLGQLDGDGTLDAIVAASENGRISVVTGGLVKIEDIVVGRDLAAVEAGDMNGDGALDIVAIDRADAGVYVALANGAGFTAPQRTATGVRPGYLQLYDHDGDGALDVFTHGTGREIWFHPGDGAGGLGEARGIVVQNSASAGFMAHRDEQGRRWLVTVEPPDVTASWLADDDQVVARTVAGRSHEQLHIDDGAPLVYGGWYFTRFSLAPSHVFTEVARDPSIRERPLALADLDLDGELDLVSKDDGVAVRRGLGDGAWAEPSILALEHPLLSLVVADVTGDGLPDLVIGDEAPALIVAIGAGDGTFTAGPPAPLDHAPDALHATADAPPAIIVRRHDPPAATALRFDAAGVVTEQTQPFADWSGGVIRSADVDGDGDDDLIARDATPALVIVRRQDDGWGPPARRSLAEFDAGLSVYARLGGSQLAVGDLDLDDRVDAVLLTGEKIVRLFDVAADAPPAPRIDDAEGWANPPVLVDIDGDGHLDLAGCSNGDMTVILLGAEGAPRTQTPLGLYIDTCVLHVDAATGGATAASLSDRGLSLLRPDLAPALGQTEYFHAGPGPLRRLGTGDIDADGRTDIVVSADLNELTGSTAVLWGDAHGVPRRADWQVSSYGAFAEIAVTPLDDRPGDDIVLARSDGIAETWTFRDGALALHSTTKSPYFWSGTFGGVGVQARGDAPSDVIVLGFTSEDHVGLTALPRGDDGRLLEDASVVLWSFPYAGGAWPMTIADFDGDGHGDIAVVPIDSAADRVRVVWGDRERSGEVTEIAVAGAQHLSTADLDGDGAPELLAHGQYGAIEIAFAGREATTTGLLPGAADVLLVADLQNDGRPELLRVAGDSLEITVRTPAGASSTRLDLDPPWTVMQAAHLDDDDLLDLVGVREGSVVTRLSAEP